MDYWLIKAILIGSLLAVTYFVIRPIKTDSFLALRRIGMLLILSAAVFAVIFPEVFQRFARSMGVMSGTNLLVYLMVIVLLAQMASAYRRDAATREQLTVLSRKIALMEAEDQSLAVNDEPAERPLDGSTEASEGQDSD